MEIIKATIKDLNTIISLKSQMFKDAELDHMLSDNCEKIIYKKYFELYNNKKALHYVYVENAEIIAMAGGFIKDDIPYCFYKENKYGFIGDMYTLPQFRKQGLAQELLNQTINWLKSNNISTIKLLASKDGYHLYKKNGFTESDELMTLKLQ